VEAWKPIVKGIAEAGCIPGIQIAHAGRKASCARPWENGGRQLTLEEGGWETVAPSPIPFESHERPPKELTVAEIEGVVGDFKNAAANALKAGFQIVEIHAAHGYLSHEFLSPLSNHRTDAYGGSYENRTRFVKQIVHAVREVWPEHLPLWVRISAEDWAEHAVDKSSLNPAKDADGYTSWNLEQSIKLSKELKDTGLVDLVDCSSGALVNGIRYPAGKNWQVPLAEGVKKKAGIATGAVGFLTEAEQCNEIVESGQADVCLLARQLLRDPYFPFRAAAELGVDVDYVPLQYQRAPHSKKAPLAAGPAKA
jgi:2,4-dienoyl-CoA reductase-like NADH-dependent reductase (Old Yellow Enzyme family)